ncbi:DUF6452 family protein [Prevotella multiformis]|uniref:Uncharacterized protein n=1 Tax=Prevotella multiformis DSM 16608 TaxID=888743 RepID=F0FAZ9_9BACT|nr:DUF6452 family protein [Prevotella multiformis]EGC18762.1 hypothetical protein HMPREF9141_2766 [Prevotella multiformis DSM 16608]
MNNQLIGNIAKRGILLSLLVTGMGWISSCSDIDCSVTNGVLANYVVQGDTLQDTLTVSAIRENRSDTVLLNRMVKTTKFSLPMSYSGDTDRLRFVFTSKTGVTTVDTVTVSKTNMSHFESVDCSPVFFHKLTSVTAKGTRISQIEISNPNVDDDGTKENILIRFTNP